MNTESFETESQPVCTDEVLTRDLLARIPGKARPYLTPMLTRAIGDLNTDKDLEEQFRVLQDVSQRILKRHSCPAAGDIRKLRKALESPQRIFGQFTGVSRTSVSHWENERTTPFPPQRAYIHAIAGDSVEGLGAIVAYLKQKRRNSPVGQ